MGSCVSGGGSIGIYDKKDGSLAGFVFLGFGVLTSGFRVASENVFRLGRCKDLGVNLVSISS